MRTIRRRITILARPSLKCGNIGDGDFGSRNRHSAEAGRFELSSGACQRIRSGFRKSDAENERRIVEQLKASQLPAANAGAPKTEENPNR